VLGSSHPLTGSGHRGRSSRWIRRPQLRRLHGEGGEGLGLGRRLPLDALVGHCAERRGGARTRPSPASMRALERSCRGGDALGGGKGISERMMSGGEGWSAVRHVWVYIGSLLLQ
jgi:hypothetical protein